MERLDIQSYINNFRRIFCALLKPDVGFQSTIYPFNKGAVIVIELGIGFPNKDDFRSSSKDPFEALKRTNIFEDDDKHQNHSFIGTNIFLIKNKIVMVKDDDPNGWTEEKAYLDIDKIVSPSKEKVNG